ncbi:MAG: protein-L-isoaspartate O-methyltransferase family protein [Betaproteobacteria bacterium]|jgi:protein-L-isoaspartate(D-aspartate) O-methyltransferase|nr:protein-L-isoaspartate O-methyltransferase [Betaproteobacteria bacterium]
MNASPSVTASEQDIESARFFMVEQQIRTWEVLDPVVLDLLMRVHREDFVPAAHRALAFADLEIPLGHGEVMLAPKIEARMLQALALRDTDNVLEVGTGSGYMTALLASLARHVCSVDILSDFTRTAGAALAAAGIRNVTLDTGDAARGWDQHGPYDAIVLTGSVPVLPEAFQQSLKPGGRLLAVTGEAPVMQAQLVTRMEGGACRNVTLFETCIPPLKNAPQPRRFVF